MRRDGSFIKTERLRTIAEKIAKGISEGKSHKVNYEEVILWIEINIGLRKVTAIEYVDLVCRSRNWIIEKDNENKHLSIRSPSA